MHSFINSIFSHFSSSLINVYAKSNTPNANQFTAQDFCHHATPRGNSHMEGLTAWAGSKKIVYCHHDRTGSAGSTEYWIWNGPGSEEPETSRECTTPMTESSSVIQLGGFPEQGQGGETSLDFIEKIDPSPRLGGHSIDQPGTPIQDDLPSLTLDSTTMLDVDVSKSYLTPLAPDLPPESFSPFLTASCHGLDSGASQQASHLGFTNSKSTDETSPLFGLGIFGITRKDDPSRVFDGLGIVRVQSSPWRSKPIFGSSGSDSAVHIQPEDSDDNHPCISDTFLHDLEAFFLTRDSTDGRGPALDFIVKEPKSMDANRKEGFLAVLSPQMSTPKKKFSKRIKNTMSLTPRLPSRPLPNLCATISGPNLRTSTSTTLAVPLAATLPRSSTTGCCSALTCSSSLSPSGSFGVSASGSVQGSAGFLRSTCSEFNSQRDRIYSSPFPSRTRQSHDSHGVVPSVSPSASARNLTVSVSMGPGPSVSGLSMGNRSLQSHSVRDLSVMGTISSDLKKVAVSHPISGSGSNCSLKGR